MSSILKALIKAEREGMAPRSDAPGPDTMYPDGRGNGPSRWLLAFAAVVLFSCGAGAAYFYFSQQHTPIEHAGGAPAVSTPGHPGTNSTSGIASSPPPSPVPTTESAVTEQPVTIITGSPQPHSVSVREPGTPAPDSRKSRLPLELPAASAPTTESLPRSPARPATASAPVPQPAPAPPSTGLRVDGIASYGTASGSLAMVNGTPVTVGSIIDGATVEGIFRDVVRFRRNGESFEIHLGASNEN